MTAIAIIPARGGSKGIPHKNLFPFCGKPLLAWSILACKKADISSVYVTSDSTEILSVAETYGARPLLRPADISGDTASSESAILHAMGEIREPFQEVVFLQATSPLRKANDVADALVHFRKNQFDSMLSVSVLEDFLIWEKKPGNNPNSINYNYLNRGRRQDRVPQYNENGSIYVFKREIIEKQNNRLGGQIGMFEMEFWQTFQIDTQEELDLISLIFTAKNLSKELA